MARRETVRVRALARLRPMARSAFAWRKLLQYCEQRRQAIAKHDPNKVKPYVAITVDETVAHACDLAPRNFPVGGPGGG
jgi:hypothetical protein